MLNIILTFINYTINEGEESLSLPACFIPYFGANAWTPELAMQAAARHSAVNTIDCFWTVDTVRCNALQTTLGCFSAIELVHYANTLSVSLCAITRVHKVKFTLGETMETQGGVEVQLYTFFILGARWGGWLPAHPERFTPGKEIQYPLYRRPQGRSWGGRNISLPSGFDSQTVQLEVSRYIYIYQPMNT
jgi:hypothetical protein